MSAMSHRHHNQPPYQHPGSGYPPSASHSHFQHHSSRHAPNGPPPPLGPIGGGGNGGPPGMPMSAPPEQAGSIGNGHSHGPPSGPPSAGMGMSSAVRQGKDSQDKLLASLATANENTWMLIGAVAEQVQDQDRALRAFETALKHNPNSILALNAVASIARARDDFDKAIEYFQRILNLKQDNGEVWGSMGHCLLMKDDLPKAYTAYQQALYHLPNPKEPKLWYGIGILYDRYGSFDHAEEAFSSVLKMDPNFEKANEIYFRLGIIYKHQKKYQASLDCFRYILKNPPRPLTSWDIWFQLGHVYEQDQDYENARDAYIRVLQHQPEHAKVLQQLGWLYHQPGASFVDHDKAVEFLTKSLEMEGTDAQSWYLLGRAFMAGQRYNKAYEAYQQAVYRDGRNPTFWCSIGVLYFQINQYRDALDAYSRAIRINPYISEVWYNLGSLYESCNNQITDAIDAYSRASELDPGNVTVQQRLNLLRTPVSNTSGPRPPPPAPVDVHPSAYASIAGPMYGMPEEVSPPRPADGPQHGGRDLAPPPPGGVDAGHVLSPGPFRGGVAPPPLNDVDETRGSMARHAPLAPMEVDRIDEARDPRDPYREGPGYNNGNRLEPINVPPRRQGGSPGPDRRRLDAPPAYSGTHNQGPQSSLYRSQGSERDEWERRERARQASMSQPSHPRGPSPRIPERAPPPYDPRQPSPRIPSDPQGYARPGEPSYPYNDRERERHANDPRERYDSRRERDERDPRGGESGAGSRALSNEPYRAASPAPSTASKASNKRGRNDENKPAKKARDTPAKKGSGSGSNGNGDKKTTIKINAPRANAEAENGLSPSKGGGRSPGSVDNGASRAPDRAIDEDYDEGALDALMSLHGDRPQIHSAPSPKSDSLNGTKRGLSPSDSAAPNSKKAKATVIEVLNPDRKDSPNAKVESGAGTPEEGKDVKMGTPKAAESTPPSAPENELKEVESAVDDPAPAAASEEGTATVEPLAEVSAEEASAPEEPVVDPTPETAVPAANEDVEMAPAATGDEGPSKSEGTPLQEPAQAKEADAAPIAVDSTAAQAEVESEGPKQTTEIVPPVEAAREPAEGESVAIETQA